MYLGGLVTHSLGEGQRGNQQPSLQMETDVHTFSDCYGATSVKPHTLELQLTVLLLPLVVFEPFLFPLTVSDSVSVTLVTVPGCSAASV